MSVEKNEYLKDRRKWLHEHKFCVRCKTQDSRTLIGKTLCAECTEKSRILVSGREIPRKYWVELGMCFKCGKTNDNGQKVCDNCHEHFVRMSQESHKFHSKVRKTDHDSNPKMPRSEWVKNGFCYLCGDKKIDSLNVCENCRQRLKNQKHSIEKRIKVRL